MTGAGIEILHQWHAYHEIRDVDAIVESAAIYGASGLVAGALIAAETGLLIEAAGGEAALGASTLEITSSKIIIGSHAAIDMTVISDMVAGTVDYACGHNENDPIKDYIWNGSRLASSMAGNTLSQVISIPYNDDIVSFVDDFVIQIGMDRYSEKCEVIDDETDKEKNSSLPDNHKRKG